MDWRLGYSVAIFSGHVLKSTILLELSPYFVFEMSFLGTRIICSLRDRFFLTKVNHFSMNVIFSSKSLGLLCGLFCFCLSSTIAQRDFSKVEIEAEKITPSVYMLTGSGGNIGLCVGKDGIFMICLLYTSDAADE